MPAPPEPDEFTLTAWCASDARGVRWMSRQGGRCNPGVVELELLDEPIDPSRYDDWVTVEGPEFEFYGETQSAEAAAGFNGPEVQRAWVHLRRVQNGLFPDSTAGRESAEFYRSVLATFSEWYANAGLAMPPFPPSDGEAKAEQNARLAYPHLNMPTLSDVARASIAAAGGQGHKWDEKRKVDTFTKALERGGYWPGGDMSAREKMALFRERVKAYVEHGRAPHPEGDT